MIRSVALDLVAPERRFPPAGTALLALALVVGAALAWRFATLASDAAALQERIEAMHAGRARPALRGGDVVADLKRAQGVLWQLGAPWGGLFDDVERAVARSEVGLIGVQPELAAGRLTIVGEAKSVGDALAFTERLDGGKVLADAFLAAHEIRQQDPQRPVRFTVSARWNVAGAQ